MEEMMDGFGAEVRTDEGSLAYNSCVRQALKLEEVYGDMEDIYDNMLPDTMELEYLIRYAAERGIEYIYATYPIVRGVFSQEMEIGEMLTCGDYDYEVTTDLGGYNYELTCTTAGVAANTNFGELEAADYIDEYQGGTITELLAPGVEDEDVEIFRARVMATFQNKAFGGNKADYRNYVNAISGVGGCKPRRREEGSSYIMIYILSADFGVPSDSIVAKVQELVDPEQNHGEGDGMAPICHNVIIKAVESDTIVVSTKITWDDGYDMETSASQVTVTIEEYFLSLRKGWEAMENESIIVRISQIEARLLSVEGVLDVTDTKLNGKAVNISLPFEHIPLRGEINVI
jgi:uncharacterized phage protein gp47/JayE